MSDCVVTIEGRGECKGIELKVNKKQLQRLWYGDVTKGGNQEMVACAVAKGYFNNKNLKSDSFHATYQLEGEEPKIRLFLEGGRQRFNLPEVKVFCLRMAKELCKICELPVDSPSHGKDVDVCNVINKPNLHNRKNFEFEFIWVISDRVQVGIVTSTGRCLVIRHSQLFTPDVIKVAIPKLAAEAGTVEKDKMESEDFEMELEKKGAEEKADWGQSLESYKYESHFKPTLIFKRVKEEESGGEIQASVPLAPLKRVKEEFESAGDEIQASVPLVPLKRVKEEFESDDEASKGHIKMDNLLKEAVKRAKALDEKFEYKPDYSPIAE